MTDMILGNRPFPAKNPVKNRRGFYPHRQPQLRLYGRQQPAVAPIEYVTTIPPTAKSAPKHASVGRSFGVNRRAPLHAKQVAPRVLRSDVPEAIRDLRHIPLTIADRHDGNAAISNRANVARELRVE